jgi:hypothetical protein
VDSASHVGTARPLTTSASSPRQLKRKRSASEPLLPHAPEATRTPNVSDRRPRPTPPSQQFVRQASSPFTDVGARPAQNISASNQSGGTAELQIITSDAASLKTILQDGEYYTTSRALWLTVRRERKNAVGNKHAITCYR